MRNKKTKLRIATWNIGRKMSKVDAINMLEWMSSKHVDVLLLQETAHTENDVAFLTNIFRGAYSYWSNDNQKTGVGQGVGIITKENIIGKFSEIVPGYLTTLDIRGKKECKILNIYKTNTSIKFNNKVHLIKEKINKYLETIEGRSIIGGDFNENDKGKVIQLLIKNNWKHERKKTKDFTYMSGNHKSFIDHFLTLNLANICTKYKIIHSPVYLQTKHLITIIDLRYKKLVGWHRPILRNNTTRVKIDFDKLFKKIQKFRSQTKKIKRGKGMKFFYKKIVKAAKKYGGIEIGNRQINREAIKLTRQIHKSTSLNEAESLKLKLNSIINKESVKRSKKRIQAFRTNGEYKFYSRRVTKPNTGLKLKYYRVRSRGNKYKFTFNETDIKEDTVKFFEQWIGWKFDDRWLPKGIGVRVSTEGKKHYYIIQRGETGFDEEIANAFSQITSKLNFKVLHQEIDKESFEKYLKSVHKSSATGCSGLPLFAIEMLDDREKESIRKFINNIIKTRDVPAFMKKLQIWNLSKKENKPCSRDNARPIGLLEHIMKVVEMIIKDRLTEILKDVNIEAFPNQFGFTNNVSTSNPIHMIDTAFGEAFEELKTLCICLADVKKAYDSILPFAIELGCRRIGMNDKDIELIMSLYENRKATILSHLGFKTKFIDVTVGLIQGSVLSPLLYKIVIGALGTIIKNMKQEGGYTFESINRQMNGKITNIPYKGKEQVPEKLTILSEFFADDKQTITQDIKKMDNIMQKIAWFYRILFKSLHPLKFELFRNYWIGTFKTGCRRNEEVIVFKYKLKNEINSNNENKVLIRNQKNEIEKVNMLDLNMEEKQHINVKIKHRCWWDQFNQKICEHKTCLENDELFSDRTYKVCEKEGEFRNLGFYMNVLEPFKDTNEKYIKNANVRIGRFLRSNVPVDMVHLIGVSCILHVYDGYYRSSNSNTLNRLNKLLSQATAKKLRMSSTPRLDFLNMHRSKGGLKLGSIKIRTVTRIMNQMENFIHAEDIESRLTFEINISRVLKKINAKRRSKLSWGDVNRHPWSITRLMNNQIDRLGRRLDLLKYYYVGINQDHDRNNWENHILSRVKYSDWHKIIAIKIWHKNLISSFGLENWLEDQDWRNEIRLSTELLVIRLSIETVTPYYESEENFWSLGGIPFCKKPKILEDGSEEIVDQQAVRLLTVKLIERSYATLRATDPSLKTTTLYRELVLTTDGKITNLVFKHAIRNFITKCITQKLSTPMILRFNSWYPNLDDEIKRIDTELGKEENVLRKCGIPGCTKKFNSNHVMDNTCVAIDLESRLRIKIVILEVILKCKYHTSTWAGLRKHNIIDGRNKDNQMQIKEIERLYNTNQGVILQTDTKTNPEWLSIVETDQIKIIMSDKEITDQMIKDIVILVMKSGSRIAIWFRNQSMFDIMEKLFPQEINGITCLMPWIGIPEMEVPNNAFNIDISGIRQLDIDKRLGNLGFVPKDYIPWLANTFKIPRKKIIPILSLFTIKMAKIIKQIYKRQLKAHRIVRQEYGIVKINPEVATNPNIVRACGMCSNHEGVLCYKHRMERFRLLRERIGKGYGKCSHFSLLMNSVIPGNWNKRRGTTEKQEIFKRGLQIMRIEATRQDCKPSELHVEGWARQARKYKTRKSQEQIERTEIGAISDYLTTYEQHMLGDFPFLVKSRKKILVQIPVRIKDELRWLISNRVVKPTVKSTTLERRCAKAYLTVQGLGYIGPKYTYYNMEDIIGRKTFFALENEPGFKRILKCSGVDMSTGTERAIFQDHSITISLNHEELQKLGYSRLSE